MIKVHAGRDRPLITTTLFEKEKKRMRSILCWCNQLSKLLGPEGRGSSPGPDPAETFIVTVTCLLPANERLQEESLNWFPAKCALIPSNRSQQQPVKELICSHGGLKPNE